MRSAIDRAPGWPNHLLRKGLLRRKIATTGRLIAIPSHSDTNPCDLAGGLS